MRNCPEIRVNAHLTLTTYDSKGRIDYVTYPNNQGTEDYSYDDTPSGRGRLSNITYPDGKSLSFSWNSRGKLTQLTAIQGGTTTTFAFNYDGMDRINEYIKSVGGIQQEQWKFYYGPTGIDKITRAQGGIQNLTIDYSTDTNGRILSMTYTEAGGYSGELFTVYDNFGNMTDLRDNSGNSAKAVLVDPNNASIAQYNPQGIDDPHSYRAREGFIGIRITDLWAGSGGTVYLQGHIVIPNPWGDAVTNGTTTTTTDDTTNKGGGDNTGSCSNPCFISCKQTCREIAENYEDCPDKSKLVWDSENCRLDEMCDKLVDCEDKITDIIDNHSGCLASWWWIYPSCWNSDYKEFRE